MTRNEHLAAADHEAAEDALAAGPEAIMAGAADPEAGPALLADLLAHELAAGHRLMLRIAAAANNVLDWGADTGEETDTAAADLAAGRLAATASRLMEQMRQGVVTLRRFRPELADDGLWIALNWLDDNCSDDELQNRIAAAKAARSASPRVQPGDPASAQTISDRALAIRALAAEDAAALATEARAGALADAAADAQGGTAFLARLYAHQLGANHALMMRITGGAHRALDRATAAAVEPVGALRLAGIAARLGDRFRRGLLTLAALSAGPDGKPRKTHGLVWGGREIPANDASAPTATAGHGVLRSDAANRRDAETPRPHRDETSGATTARAARNQSSSAPLRLCGESTVGHGVHRPDSQSLLRRAA